MRQENIFRPFFTLSAIKSVFCFRVCVLPLPPKMILGKYCVMCYVQYKQKIWREGCSKTGSNFRLSFVHTVNLCMSINSSAGLGIWTWTSPHLSDNDTTLHFSLNNVICTVKTFVQ